MSFLQYLHPDDDLAPTITPTLIVGTQDAAYPIANLADGDPQNPWKTSSTTFRLVWDLGAATAIRFFGLIHDNLAAALSGVVVDMDATAALTPASWASPAFRHTLVKGAYGEDKFPLNPYMDLGPTGLPSYRYLSLAATSANTVAVAIGLVGFASTLREFSTHYSPGAVDDEDHPVLENESEIGGVETIYRRGVRRRNLTGGIRLGPGDAAKLRALNRNAEGRGRPFWLLPHLDLDEAWYCRFGPQPLPRTTLLTGVAYDWPLVLTEVGRGKKPQPSAV